MIPVLLLAARLLQSGVYIEANTPITMEWAPLPTTINYRILIDGEQIGADFPKEFFNKATWTFGPATPGLHLFEMFSIDSAGVRTQIPVIVNGKPTGLVAPTNPKLAK